MGSSLQSAIKAWNKTIIRDGISHQFSVSYEEIKRILPLFWQAIRQGDITKVNDYIETYSHQLLEELDDEGNSVFFYARRKFMIHHLARACEVGGLSSQEILNRPNKQGITLLEQEALRCNFQLDDLMQALIDAGASIELILQKYPIGVLKAAA